MKRSRWNTVFSLIFFSFSADAGFKGSIEFNEAEKLRHESDIERIAAESTRCMQDQLEAHQRFYAAHGISKYYGDQSSFAKLSYAAKKTYLKNLRLNPSLVDEMEPTSCIGMAMKCFGIGFNLANETAIWSRVVAYTRLNNTTGDALQHALLKLGWKSLYWNPDPSLNATWDRREKAADPTNRKYFWGMHAVRYAQVMRDGVYLWNAVSDRETLVNFKTSPPQSFKDVPIFLGTAHMGYHVFPGVFGNVIEAHSTRLITDPQTVESTEFNPLKDGGAPRGNYFSGLIVVPPKFGF